MVPLDAVKIKQSIKIKKAKNKKKTFAVKRERTKRIQKIFRQR